MLRLQTLVLVLLVAALATARGVAATPKGSVSPVCAASKLAWTGTAACTRFKDGICATIPTCPALCPSLGGADGCNFVDGGELQTTLENYPTKTELTTTLESYPTKTELQTTLDETLKDYVKTSDVASTYITRSEVYNQLGNFVTMNQLTSILQNYQRRA